MTRGRDYTRYQNARAHAKWRKRLANVWRDPEDLVNAPGRIDSMAKSMPKCSSPFCCGNPRHKKGKVDLPVQEMRGRIAADQEIREYHTHEMH